MKKYFFIVVLCLSMALLGMAQFAMANEPSGLSINYENETVTGVTNEMEYSINDGGRWTSVTGSPSTLRLTDFIPSANAQRDVNIWIRFKGNPTASPTALPASSHTSLPLPRRPATPVAAEVRFDGFSESIIATAASLQYRIGSSGNFIAFPAGGIPNVVATSSSVYQVRVPPTGASFASTTRNVTVPGRPSGPSVSYNSANDTITGVNRTMQFSVDGGASWNAISTTSLNRDDFGSAASVMVRVLPTATTPLSNPRTINLPRPPAGPPSSPVLDRAAEVVNGVDRSMEYSTNNGGRWTSISGNPLNITNLIPSGNAANVTLLIRFRATSADAASQSISIPLDRRPAAPPAADVSFNAINETVVASGTSLQWRLGTSANFAAYTGPITNVVGPAARTYQVRYSSTADAFASMPRSVAVRSRPAAPNAAYNGTSDTITGVSRLMEFGLSANGPWTSASTTSLTRSEFGSAAVSIFVRVSATATVPASAAREVRVPAPGGAIVGSFVVNYGAETITGVARGMEYSVNRGGRWTAISGNVLNISNLIPAASAANDVELWIRTKGTNTAAASLHTVVILNKRPATPPASEMRFDGFTETIRATLSSLQMEFRVTASGRFNDVPADGVIPVSVGNTIRNVQIRYAAVEGSSFASAVRVVSAPARRTSPTSSYQRATDRIINVSHAHEYSLDGGVSWIDVPSDPRTTFLTREEFGNAAVTVWVRARATESLAMSNVKRVIVPAATP